MIRCRLAPVLLVAAIAVIPGCSGRGGQVTITVIGPSSGPQSRLGIEARRGAQLAAARIDASGGLLGHPVRIIFRDESRRTDAVSLLRDVVARDRPLAVIGPTDTGSLVSGNDPLSAAGIAAITITGSQGSVAANAHLFRLVPSNAVASDAIVGWVVGDRRFSKVAVVSGEDAQSVDGARAIASNMRKRAVSAVVTTQIGSGLTDLTTVAQSLRSAGADAVILWAPALESARFMSAVSAIGWSPQIVGPQSWIDDSLRSVAGSATDNVAFASESIAPEVWFSDEMRKWFLDYHRRFTVAPIPSQRTLVTDLSVTALKAFDAVGLIADAAKRADSLDAEDISRELARTRSFKGLLRTYSFGRAGEAIDAKHVTIARFYNLAVLYDVVAPFDAAGQVAFYKVQVSAFGVPPEYQDTPKGREVARQLLEDVLTDPEKIDFFRPYVAPKTAPGHI